MTNPIFLRLSEYEARPTVVTQAKDAVNCLSKASLTELKNFSNPPSGVPLVTTAVLIMLKGEKKNFSWDNAKKMMAKVDAFKTQLEKYRGEDISEETMDQLKPILERNNLTLVRLSDFQDPNSLLFIGKPPSKELKYESDAGFWRDFSGPFEQLVCVGNESRPLG